MSRYADVDKLYDFMNRANIPYNALVKEAIDYHVTTDVVEVVRCKDCKHRIYDGSRDLYYCEMYHGMGDVSDDNYCSFGERADT